MPIHVECAGNFGVEVERTVFLFLEVLLRYRVRLVHRIMINFLNVRVLGSFIIQTYSENLDIDGKKCVCIWILFEKVIRCFSLNQGRN